MGGKRKKTADRKIPPLKGRPGRKSASAPSPVVVEASALAASSAFGGKRKKTADRKSPPSKGPPGRKSVAAPSPVAVEAPALAASSAMVPHHQQEGEPGLLVPSRGAVVVSAEEEKVVKLDFDVPMRVLKCDVCHGLLKAPIFQCSLLQHVACRSCSELHGGKCRRCADLAASAVYVQNSYLDTLFGYIKEACPYKKYGCTTSVGLGDQAAAHEAACAFEPCSCTHCSFKGSQADLVRHLRHRHKCDVHKFTYGQDYVYEYDIDDSDDEMESSMVCLCFIFFVGEDGGVFHLVVDLTADFEEFPFPAPLVSVVCFRNRAAAAAGPAYSYWITADAPPAERRKLKPEIKEVASCLDWKVDTDCHFPVVSGMLREGRSSTSGLFRICIIKDESSSASC